jgi:DGQHR domain-containing protein
VDGQQRSRALASTHRDDLLVPVTAFVTDDVVVQRDQFLRINSVKPLPAGLITELLPTLDTPLPAKLEARKVPSLLCDRLARDTASPFAGLIRRASTPRSERKQKFVTDTALVKSIQDSLSSPSGCLFPHQNVATGEVDVEVAWSILRTWWTAVRNTFPDAWGRPPRESRLMHSVGIRAMGALMDRVMPGIDASSPMALSHVEAELAPLRSVCRWTEGRWTALDGMAWDDLQCVTRHIRALSRYLADVHAQHAYA